MKIVMLGAPGAGKGTQAKRIAAKFSIPHISTGDIFRANIKNNTPLGAKAKSYMDKGELVPDELVIELIMDRFAQDDCVNGYVLDGFPRTIPQAEELDKALKSVNDNLDYAIDVEVPDDNIINRMSGRRACVNCGATYHIVHNPPKVENVCDTCTGELILRDDDKPETVKNRLDVYHSQTEPLLKYYTEKGILGVLGASGCGKSMTLKCIAGIETPDEGKIILNGRVLFDAAEIDSAVKDCRIYKYKRK